MTGLLNDLTDFARTRLGDGISLELDRDALLAPALDQAITEVEMTYSDAKIETVFKFADPVNCDVERIKRLLSNLLANAVKYGAEGSVIKVSALDKADQFILSVANTGEPIPSESHDRLFEPYFRGEVRPSQHGLGLGLFICREIARAHGANLKVSSSPNETVFTFEMTRQ